MRAANTWNRRVQRKLCCWLGSVRLAGIRFEPHVDLLAHPRHHFPLGVEHVVLEPVQIFLAIGSGRPHLVQGGVI